MQPHRQTFHQETRTVVFRGRIIHSFDLDHRVIFPAEGGIVCALTHDGVSIDLDRFNVSSVLLLHARIPSQVQQLKDLAAKAKEFRAASIAGTINVHRDSSIDPAGAGGHDEDTIAHVNCFIDVMGDQEHRG